MSFQGNINIVKANLLLLNNLVCLVSPTNMTKSNVKNGFQIQGSQVQTSLSGSKVGHRVFLQKKTTPESRKSSCCDIVPLEFINVNQMSFLLVFNSTT